MTTHRISNTLSLVIGSATACVAALAWAQTSDGLLVFDQPIGQDTYAAHREIEVRSSIDGDFVAAGRRVTVDGEVAGDVIVAAQSIEIRAPVNDDLRLAGQHIRLSSPVSGHVVAAGQTVIVDEDIGEWAWLAGYSVEVLGDVGGDLKIRANRIRIDAEVAGDIELVGNALDLGPNAVVRGNLKWRSRNEANISPDAQIDGTLIEEPPTALLEELGDSDTYTLPINLIVAVTILFLLFPRPLLASADRVATRLGRSLLFGIAAFLGAPLLAILLFATGIGVWLGFAVLFVYLLTLLLGVMTGLFSVSYLTLRRFRQQPALWQSLVAIFVTVVAVSLLAMIPWLGLIIVLSVWLTGIGALCWNAWATLRSFGGSKHSVAG